MKIDRIDDLLLSIYDYLPHPHTYVNKEGKCSDSMSWF